MSASQTRRKRRKRRQQNAALRHGPGAKPRHASPSGRTGRVHSVHLRSRR